MYYVYLLKLRDNSYYTGSTDDIEKRIKKHNKGDVLATKGKRPISLVFYCAFPTKEQAVEFEKYLKSGSGQSFRNKHLI
ncbi:MAG: GIY-YIG nuclease family protein [bacterium]